MMDGCLFGGLLGVIAGFFFGVWRGRRLEGNLWRLCAILPGDHMRSAGRDYKVMTLDAFHRQYHNPLAAARFAAAHTQRESPKPESRAGSEPAASA